MKSTKTKITTGKSHRLWRLGLAGLTLCAAGQTQAAVGNMLWEENFNTLNPSVWNTDVGDGCAEGLCGWGNQELQWYAQDNVSIEPIPGETGNNALVLEARNETANGKAFTSGKINSSNNISIQYGMIEVRMRTPQVGVGLWPAAWMLGTSTATWPAKGEIDMMEMGHKADERLRQGHGSADINSYVGSNLIFHADDACSTGNPSCAASIAYDVNYNKPYVAATPLTDRFVTYRTYWTDTEIRFTITDNGVEHDLYEAPFTISEVANEFQAPFYLLLNLAVGGNFTDAMTNGAVTAPKPAKMLVDYIRVYELDGQGQVFVGNTTQPETGTFGVFTDTTATSNQLEVGVSSDIYIWDPNTTQGNIAANEGDNVIAWQYPAAGNWFGGGIQARQAQDMSNFADGDVTFDIHMPADVTFKIGVTDTFSNENWIEFPANTTKYGLTRNGQWGQVTIPVADLRGSLVALQSMQYLFAIASVDGQFPGAPFQMAIDDIVWTGGAGAALDSDGDGVDDTNDLCANTPAGVVVNADGCPVLVTAEVLVQAEDYSNYFDTSTGNNGGQYRTDDVDIEASADTDGGYNVGWTAAGEWLEYSVLLGAGTYDMSTRVASNVGGASYSLLLDGNVLGTDNVGFTGGWQAFESHDVAQVTVAEGLHTLRVEVNGGEFNLNWINILLTAPPEPEPVVDADNDGVIDSVDLCANTPSGTAVDANGCKMIVPGETGLTQTSDSSVTFYVNSSAWADVHYIVNNNVQQNFRMTFTGGQNIKALTGLTQGDNISYWFTYLTSGGPLIDTPMQTHTMGSIAPTDSDGDGVLDNIDQCANTPAGTSVDGVGCPIVVIGDADNDGVLDNIDQCANTPAGTSVDGVGCPIVVIGDADNDGVLDNVDQCPNTAAGAAVDSVGCVISTPVNLSEVAAADERLVGGADSNKPGFTLYVFDNDQASSGSTCNDGCAVNWPPVLVTDGLASGVSDLSTITRADGSMQATYNGRPLYFYIGDAAVGDTNGQGQGGVWWSVEFGVLGSIVPLYGQGTVLEQAIHFDRGDAVITRFADRGRDRHAKEDQFQSYDHYLTHYWTHRTARFEFVDYVAKGGSSIVINFVTEWRLGAREFRAWYYGMNTVAEYHGNYQNNVLQIGQGTFDDNLNQVSSSGNQYKYSLTINEYRNLHGSVESLAAGQQMEIEVSQFLSGVPEGRANYYGTTYLYMVGEGGLVPWYTVGDFAIKSSERENSHKLDESAWLGGKTTLPYNYTNEPDNHFMQMATNLSSVNGQPFVLGRRVHHTDFETGQHDESLENGIFPEMVGKAGSHYVNTSCSGCHERNGRAAPVAIGVPLDKWVFKVGDGNGNPDPQIGRVLQPGNVGINDAVDGEGNVSIASWTELNGLRSPNYAFSKNTPAQFSARIAPQLVGLGLLEAIPETAVLALEDITDANNDGISGKAQRTIDPVTGDTRLGRFGYKAGTTSVKHQIAGAFNTDMGVMTSVLPTPDCGSAQTVCGNSGSELANEHLDHLVKYIALLGVRPQRDIDDTQVQQGQALFSSIGCDGCHTPTFQTSANHPFSELRDQTIHPYTDLLVHDMGPGLADNLGEGQATGAEWRTTPLWGLGLSACVTGGVTNPTGGQGNEICTPEHSYLHDGRARSISEAILWHGGEGENAKQAFEALSAGDKNAVLAFLGSL